VAIYSQVVFFFATVSTSNSPMQEPAIERSQNISTQSAKISWDANETQAMFSLQIFSTQ
jgi:hypothetical protein